MTADLQDPTPAAAFTSFKSFAVIHQRSSGIVLYKDGTEYASCELENATKTA